MASELHWAPLPEYEAGVLSVEKFRELAAALQPFALRGVHWEGLEDWTDTRKLADNVRRWREGTPESAGVDDIADVMLFEPGSVNDRGALPSSVESELPVTEALSLLAAPPVAAAAYVKWPLTDPSTLARLPFSSFFVREPLRPAPTPLLLRPGTFFCWLYAGHRGTGSKAHIDVLNSSAWLTLTKGLKHWLLVHGADHAACKGEAGEYPELLDAHANKLSSEAAGIPPTVRLYYHKSTIISHGMPYPQNVKTARAVEEVVRTHGAVPATIAVLSGIIRIGLEPDDLELLGKTGPAVMKCSRRDLAHHSMDVSTDLTELGRTPVAVVCAGVKSILDIPLTLEYLETQGVPVMTIDATEFPAFFTRKSGCLSHLTGTVHDAAKLVFHQEVLGLQTGIVIANPITPSAEAEAGVINEATTRALAMANEQHVLGKDITPFLLDKINVLSAGKSLTANIALVLNNAKVGAQLANRLAALRKAEFGMGDICDYLIESFEETKADRREQAGKWGGVRFAGDEELDTHKKRVNLRDEARYAGSCVNQMRSWLEEGRYLEVALTAR
eukprot:gene17834-27482_t